MDNILEQVLPDVVKHLPVADIHNLLSANKKYYRLLEYKNIRKIVIKKHLTTFIENKVAYEKINSKWMAVLPAFGYLNYGKHEVSLPQFIQPLDNRTFMFRKDKGPVEIPRLGESIQCFSVDRNVDYVDFLVGNTNVIRFEKLIKDKKYVLGNGYVSDFPIVSNVFMGMYFVCSEDVEINVTFAFFRNDIRDELIRINRENYMLKNKKIITFVDGCIWAS